MQRPFLVTESSLQPADIVACMMKDLAPVPVYRHLSSAFPPGSNHLHSIAADKACEFAPASVGVPLITS